jgi:hypothetical protein
LGTVSHRGRTFDGLIQADSWKARARCITNWGPTAICVPTEGFSKEV